jgi:hypothetical protein
MLGAVSGDQHHSQGHISSVEGSNPIAEQASMGYQTQGTFGSSASSEDSDGPSHSPGHHPTPGPGQQEGHMQFACHACKVSKVRTTRMLRVAQGGVFGLSRKFGTIFSRGGSRRPEG